MTDVVTDRAGEEGEARERIRPKGSRSNPWMPLWVVATALCTIPFLNLVRDTFTGGLGADPVVALIHRTGWWALTLLMVTLAVTPVRRLTGWNRIIQVRKSIGLMSFFYACLHFALYIGVDQFFAFSYIIEDILERPYITAGTAALAMLTALAVTSRRDSIRRLGGKRWRRIHALIYPAAVLGALHYYWLVKADTGPPLLFAGIVVLLLALRLPVPGRGTGSRQAGGLGSGRAVSAVAPESE